MSRAQIFVAVGKWRECRWFIVSACCMQLGWWFNWIVWDIFRPQWMIMFIYSFFPLYDYVSRRKAEQIDLIPERNQWQILRCNWPTKTLFSHQFSHFQIFAPKKHSLPYLSMVVDVQLHWDNLQFLTSNWHFYLHSGEHRINSKNKNSIYLKRSTHSFKIGFRFPYARVCNAHNSIDDDLFSFILLTFPWWWWQNEMCQT